MSPTMVEVMTSQMMMMTQKMLCHHPDLLYKGECREKSWEYLPGQIFAESISPTAKQWVTKRPEFDTKISVQMDQVFHEFPSVKFAQVYHNFISLSKFFQK